ncbi:universal stress protein [Microbacterium cremeum]|uniref:universal stress protein n=1 Tax=Microbacterium cremeum TaxID=2782169 RepID=UPI0018874194|nr:universal stress protein [Microbacterium cremeum]
MERIYLGFDGSPGSISALSWVAARAERADAKVGLVSVVSRLPQERRAGLAHLAHAEEYLRDRAPGVGVELHRLEGSVAGSFSDFAGDADLLVVGTNAGRPVRVDVAGAAPVRAGSHAHVPVVMVPAGWVDVGEPVTVGIADDESSGAALAFAAAEAYTTDTSIRLVHAWLMPTPSFSGTTALVHSPESAMAEHRAKLDAAVSWVIERFPIVDLHSELVRDSRSAALLRFAPRSSMLVVGTHHRGVPAASLLGTVVQEVLWRAESPVAVVPGGAVSSRSWGA